MGLAAHGEFDEDIVGLLESQLNTGPDYDVTAITGNGISGGVNRLESLFETNRLPRDSRPDFTKFHKNLAFATQYVTEKIICNIVQKYTTEYDIGNVCFAGGVALNCKVNQAISKLDSVDRLFTQPVANDAGIAIGAGLAAHESTPKNELSNLYVGPGHPTEEIEHLLTKAKLEFKKHEDVVSPAAKHLEDGKIVAWFQGRMELGPRALGNRSILANPALPDMKDKINKSVKNREDWRPFAPSVLIDHANDYFEGEMYNSSFMIQTHDVVQSKISEIPAVIHGGDHTARPQVVREDQNPKYYDLINEFYSLTGVPVLLNTSLNDNGEPIIEHPKDALKFFFSNGIDVLVIDNFILEK
jgi:carbamoyltransferase